MNAAKYPITMIHLSHPCFGVDVCDAENERDKTILVEQGYVPLENVKIWADAKKLLERSGMDITLCANCGLPIIVIPEGLPQYCENCIVAGDTPFDEGE